MNNNSRLFTKLSIICFFVSVFGSVLISNNASAFSGSGYFNPSWTVCSTNFSLTLTCGGTSSGDISASKNNVIYPAPSIPTTKPEFIAWLETNSGTSAGKFIIATMMGSPTEKDNLQGAKDRINNPNITLSKVTGNPRDYGTISLYGKHDSGAGERDYFFVNNYYPGSVDLLLFKDASNNVYYVLELKCANPVGGLPGLPSPAKWSISASSTSNVSSAKPGDTIVWTHKLKNDGPTATNSSIHSNLAIDIYNNATGSYAGTGFNNGWGGSSQSEWAAADVASGAAVGTIRTITNYATYTVSQSDVSDTNSLCERVQYDPTDYRFTTTTYRDGRGNWSCVSVPYKYSLAPNVSLDVSGAIEADSLVNITPSVTNSGPTNSRNTNWELTQLIVDPGQSIPPGASGGTSAKDPCGTYFKVPGIVQSCSNIAKGVSGFNVDGTVKYVSGNQFINYSDTTTDLPAGSKICYSLAVKHYSEDSSDTKWMHSAPKCVVIVKKPKTQIWGGDLRVDGLVNASNSVKNIAGVHTFGSWIEYGIFATGSISGAASGSAFAGTAGLPGNNIVCDYSRLTFTSAGAVSCSPATTKGNYNSSHTIPDIEANFPGGTVITNNSIIVNDLHN